MLWACGLKESTTVPCKHDQSIIYASFFSFSTDTARHYTRINHEKAWRQREMITKKKKDDVTNSINRAMDHVRDEVDLLLLGHD